jgi:hypothetical protein
MSNTFPGVVGLVNRLQRACGALGEHAGSNDIATSVPNLWNLLPSVVVIGGQVSIDADQEAGLPVYGQ